ncbi:outer membrane protein TolC [Mesorhizobium sangaii]|uniref:Outer membrane protein TolC n=1 Tax=Mesorhizobium sangaii TaxID=505389 RepID=A0A841PFH5_9HYPH|nr:TolC family protein [Mesorhizobium sangaii]MBB6413947.1 outer membrane protein TolC [Mesorhizobium sangaii]
MRRVFGEVGPRCASAGVSGAYRNTLPAASEEDGTTNSASIGATLTIPIYSGARTSAVVRRSKESLSQARIEVDVSHEQVRQAVTAGWTEYTGQQSLAANGQVIEAPKQALNGVEESNVGQRTRLRRSQRPSHGHRRKDQTDQC